MDKNDRFLEVLNNLGLNAYELEKKGVKNAQAKISHYKNGVTKGISTDIIVSLCVLYPKVNANYILTGQGNMFLSESDKINKYLEKEQSVSNELNKAMLDVINEQKREIDKLIKLTNILLEKLPNNESMLENKKID